MNELNETQMKELTHLFQTEGFPVELKTGEEWGGDDVFTVDWGNWWIGQDGMLHVYDDHFPVNDCDLVAFIETAHRLWHKVGGKTGKIDAA